MKLTVYMIAYNAERFIAEAIESVLRQTYTDFEFLMVDDGSTDKTRKIMHSYSDSRIRFLGLEHGGFARGLNTAINTTTSDYILGVDSDDYIADDYIEKMVACAEKNPFIDYLYPSKFTPVDENGSPSRDARKWKKFKDYPNSKNLLLNLYQSKHSLVPNPGSLKKISMLKRVGPFRELATCEDFDFLCRNALDISFKRVGDSSTYFYRRLKSGNSNSNKRNKMKSVILKEMEVVYDSKALGIEPYQKKPAPGKPKLLICSPWENAWVRYYRKFFAEKYDVSVYKNKYTVNYHTDADLMVKEHQAIDWADIVLFGWTDPFLKYWSNRKKVEGKQYIAFLRSYELFNTTMPWLVDWNKVDHLVFVNPTIQGTFLKNVKNLSGREFHTPTHIIPNAIDLDEWKFVDRKPNGKISWVSGLNYKKGIQLLLQFASKMPNEYYIDLAGNAGDLRSSLYYEYIREDMGLAGKLSKPDHYDNMQEFLKDKSFELMTSLIEGHPNAILETMAVGMKPIIHNYPGSRNMFPEKYIWNTVDEAVKMLEGDYDSAEYRSFIEDKYDMNRIYPLIEGLF